MALHWKILVGMGVGLLIGMGAIFSGQSSFVISYIHPLGIIFINLLKLIAVPLIIVSLIKGVTSLTNLSQLSRMGFRTLTVYIFTTLIAISIGLGVVNLLQPGRSFSEEKRQAFQEQYGKKAFSKTEAAQQLQKSSPLQFLVDIVPDNVFRALSDNGRMIQVIFFSLFLGLALVMIAPEHARPVIQLFDGLNEAILKMIEIIMWGAPYGVAALLAGLLADFAGDRPADALELLGVLGYYAIVVLLGLLLMVVFVYGSMVQWLAHRSFPAFLKAIAPAQLLAFSTSSSAATLPVTMEQVEKKLHIPPSISGFVLPLGATINMDGTSLYQAVAAVFIAQAFGYDLTMVDQLTILFTALLASIGSAAVPGAGLVMLVIVLESVGIDPAGLALIFAVDRILDMARTVVNVTGDAVVCTLIHAWEPKADS